MIPKAYWQRIGVHRVDESTDFGLVLPDQASTPAPAQKKAPPQKQRRFREAVPEYRTLLSGTAKATADEFYAACLERWTDRWVMRNLRSLTEEEVRAYLAELAQKGHSDAEIRREKGLLQSFYRWACRCGWADEDPTRRLRRLPHLPAPCPVAWTGVEQRRLLDACSGSLARSRCGGTPSPEVKLGCVPPLTSSTLFSTFPPSYLYPLVLVGLRTGLRLGNLLSLQWQHVNFSSGRIVLPPSQVKTSRRVEVPLSVDAGWVLRELLGRAQLMPRFPVHVFDAVNMPRWKAGADARQVLLDFRIARQRARIPEGDFHSLRLSFLRNCARAGVPPQVAARMADWEDENEVAEIYRQNSPPRIVGRPSW